MTSRQGNVVTEHPFLNEISCHEMIALLEEHRELALDRNPANPGAFVTYGRAAYLDLCLPRANPEQDYFGALPASNDALLAILSDFYKQLLSKVEALLGEPTAYDPQSFALPGIHIFRGNGIRSASEAGSHFDVQYQKLRLKSPIDQAAPPISITIPLKNPHYGTGLQVYDVTYEDYARAYEMGRITTLDQLVRRKTSAYYPYHIGELILHRGLVVHCITSPGPILPSDERITIQGHGIRCNGTWILYW